MSVGGSEAHIKQVLKHGNYYCEGSESHWPWSRWGFTDNPAISIELQYLINKYFWVVAMQQNNEG